MRKKDSTLSNEVLENLNSKFSENHPYRRSFSGFALQFQFSVALGDDMFYDSKAQSRAAGGFGAALVHTVEALEDPLGFRRYMERTAITRWKRPSFKPCKAAQPLSRSSRTSMR